MDKNVIEEKARQFYRFYEDDAQETRPMYEDVIQALISSGNLDGKTFDVTITEGGKEQKYGVVIRDGKLVLTR